jgi:hypothetical protein
MIEYQKVIMRIYFFNIRLKFENYHEIDHIHSQKNLKLVLELLGKDLKRKNDPDA